MLYDIGYNKIVKRFHKWIRIVRVIYNCLSDFGYNICEISIALKRLGKICLEDCRRNFKETSLPGATNLLQSCYYLLLLYYF